MAEDTYCASCGTQLPDGARFCPGCGAARGGALAPTVIDEPVGPAEAPPPAPEPAADAPGAQPVAGRAAQPDTEPLERGEPTEVPAPNEPKAPVADPSPQSPATAPLRPAAPSSAGQAPPSSPGPQSSARSQGAARPDAGRSQGPPPPEAPPRPGQLGDAAELGRRLSAHARRPAVAVPAAAGALAALMTVALGLIMAVAFPDEDSLIGVLGMDANLLTESLRHAVSFLQVSFDQLPFPQTDDSVDLHGRTAPLLLLAAPVGACALAAALLGPRTQGASAKASLVSAAGTALTFAVLMLIAALLCGDASPSLAGTFFLSLLWGGLGAVAGAAIALRRAGTPSPRLDSGPGAIPPSLGLVGRVAASSLRPLGLLLLVTGVLGTAAWVTHSLVDEGGDENRARATVEVALYAVDHAVHFAELGAFVAFEPAEEELEEAALPAPTAEADEITGNESYRIFAYRDALPAYLFVPGIIVLIALPLLLALYGGFIAAGIAGAARTPAPAAAWGAIVGPVWAIAMALLDALATKPLEVEALGDSRQLSLFGSADGGAAFLYFLLVGAALGAVGGLLAASSGPQSDPGGAGRGA